MAQGGQAVFQFNVLQGDANRDGTIDQLDVQEIYAHLNTQQGQPNYSPTADLNSDGTIDGFDVYTWSTNQGGRLPRTDGIAPTVASITPNPAAALSGDISQVIVRYSEPMRSLFLAPPLAVSARSDWRTAHSRNSHAQQ